MEKSFLWLKRKKQLRLDFYLPEYNIAIECHGSQHFGVKMKGKYEFTEKDYEDTYARDLLKNKLCKEHSIRILYYCRNKKWIKDDYIDVVYSKVSELMKEICNTQKKKAFHQGEERI